MNLLSLLVMLFFTLISFLLIRSLAPFEATSKLKYISLNNRFLANCLIPKKKGYVKVNDRKKISLFSLLFYLLFAIFVVVLILMFILPDIPCDEFIARFGKRGQINWRVTTLNEKLIILLPILFFLIALITFFSIGIARMIKEKTESKKSLCGIFAIYILLVALLVFFAFELC